jgi:AAA+ superfamily predicted ATPase
VIFATNLAANFDQAFERRLRTHVLFEMPGLEEREAIWRVQMHPTLTPLADDVDFGALAAAYEVSGGDIRNAVLKAALAAAAEPGRDAGKAIHQRHLDAGMRDVLAGKRVMKQSLLDDLAPPAADPLDVVRDIRTHLQRSLMPATILSACALVVAILALAVAMWR